MLVRCLIIWLFILDTGERCHCEHVVLSFFLFLLRWGRHRRRKYLGTPRAAAAAEFCSFSTHHTHTLARYMAFSFLFPFQAATVAAADICFDLVGAARWRGGGGGVPDLEEMRESETRRRKATLLGVVLGLRRWHGCAHGDGGVSFWGMETCRWR